ncbi:GTP-binding protein BRASSINAZOLE INSENSITIVE PALE GREEN 2, chloroplastic-like [Actinidia eriantha]|uniref:GTP-binding protein BRASSINAZOLE INSENSITIVE PALE GREEN 2, chloroplastic-like n=1 Tax=Actinidia eriantha TaxID=165200 RepID=UPI0025905012|nr:GTP-binding protein BRASSINAZOLE INSENSITIVE PALE GREEN 2, chloroplastic-like [Actinidia eriantha]
MIVRALSPSKLKHLLPFSPFIHTYTVPLSTSPPSLFDPQTKPYPQNPTKTLPSQLFLRPFSSLPKTRKNSTLPLNRDGNYDESPCQTLLICPGCGVPMQDTDPKQPGFFVKPSPKNPDYKSPIDRNSVAEEPEISISLKRGFLKELVEPENDDNGENPNPNVPEKPVVCARCHSLRHYGKVKDPTVENLLPDFDFDHTVGRKLNSVSGARTVVLMVVDAADFDGSFPRKVAKLVSSTIDENYTAWKDGKSGNVPRVVLVVTKIDLVPSSVSPTRFEHWVRSRAREGGANKITSVHLVSAVRDWGLKNLFDDVVGLAGQRGNVWAIGAQNAGKSTLINSIGKHGGGKITHLTEAPVPGTTLGIVRVEGVLPGQVKLFDTPGLLHPHQISTRLNREEQRLVQISKELKPRTYRIKAGHSVHIGGLMRLDIEESSVDSVYITVWASPYLPLHMGKTENVHNMLEDHFGRQLQPPNGEKRVNELGQWVRKEFRVCGNSWDSSSVDIAAAGLGWFAIGLKGEALLGVWTYDGVDVILRNSLIPHRANSFEVAGFTVSKIVSKADQASNKQQRQSGKKQKQSELKAEVAAA